MQEQKCPGFDCASLENDLIELLIPRSVGPRILSLRFNQGINLLAELPHFKTLRPDGREYRFYGGHRLWASPEDPIRSYALDDIPLEISESRGGLLIVKPSEQESGIEKSIHVALAADAPRVILTHTLVNRTGDPVQCAPWAITQLRPGGVALLPQADLDTGLLPNRQLTLWPYTDIQCPQLTVGNRVILLNAQVRAPLKIGFPNPRGWLGYCIEGTLFVKRADFDARASYPDLGCSSECYCCPDFIELETLAPLHVLAPGASVSHTETWELFGDVESPQNEKDAQALIDRLGPG